MLSVLMKYDFKRLWKVTALLCGGVIGCSVIASIITWWLNTHPSGEYELNLLEISMSMALATLYFIISAATAVMSVFIIYYFYKNLMTDEGYLTFTLPTTPGKILLSKFVVSLCCLLLVSFFIFAGNYMIDFVNYYTYDSYGLIGTVEESYSTAELVDLVLTPISDVVGSAFNILAAFMAFTIGSCTVKKNKVGASIGYYILLMIGISILTSIVALILQLFVNDSTDIMVVYNIQAVIEIILNVVLSIPFFFISRHLLTNRLNLQ